MQEGRNLTPNIGLMLVNPILYIKQYTITVWCQKTEKTTQEAPQLPGKTRILARQVLFPEDFLWDYDVRYLNEGYATRSAAIRDAMKDQMKKWSRERKQLVSPEDASKYPRVKRRQEE